MADAIDTRRLQEQKVKAISELQSRLKTWKTFQNDYQSLEEMLNVLPDKISHDIMVPFGSLAFMPGKLVHTNEILVLLGDNWFAKRSASQAIEIVKRRQKYVEENIESINKELEFFSSQLNFTQEFENINKIHSDIIEIKEEIKDDKKHKAQGPRIAHEKANQFAPKRVKQFQASKVQEMTKEDQELFAKLDRLELHEKRNKELDTMEEINDSENVKYITQGLPKHTEVRFADELKLNNGSDSDESSDSEDQTSTKTIVVNFTTPVVTPASETANEPTSSLSPSKLDLIKTPTDIYQQYKPTPKSILKSTSVEKESSTSFDVASKSLRGNKDNEVSKAFSGEIIERSMDNVPVPVPVEPAPKSKPKRISKFKAERKS